METYLPAHNLKFAVPTREPADLHQSLDGFKLAGILCMKEERTLQNDWCVSYRKRWLQLEKVQLLVLSKKERITVSELLDGSLRLELKGKQLAFRELRDRPAKVPGPLRSTAHASAANHPRKHGFFNYSSAEGDISI